MCDFNIDFFSRSLRLGFFFPSCLACPKSCPRVALPESRAPSRVVRVPVCESHNLVTCGAVGPVPLVSRVVRSVWDASDSFL